MKREYPTRPIVAVGAVILAPEGVVLVKRRYEPLKGQWSLPGGAVEVGEPLEQSIAREVEEETGLIVDVGPIVDVFDRILLDADGRVQYHFVLIDYLCRPIGGHLAAGSDVDEAVIADPNALEPYALTTKALEVIAKAVKLI